MYRTRTLDAIASQRNRAQSAHPWLYRLVFGLDAWLRRWTLVAEYSPDPRCVFRVQLGHLDQDVALPDGTIAHAGDRVIDLHLWNEHVPLMPKQGATIAWARRMCFCIEVSLRELAKHLVARPELDDISVIRANITFGIPDQSVQMSRLCQRYGFQAVGTLNPTKMLQRAHRLGENILISFMALALNGNSLRRGTLRRDHVQVFLSRKLLARRR